MDLKGCNPTFFYSIHGGTENIISEITSQIATTNNVIDSSATGCSHLEEDLTDIGPSNAVSFYCQCKKQSS